MLSSKTDSSLDNWHDYEVESRREIIALLRAICAKKQLVTLVMRGKSDIVVTSLLAVDPEHDVLILDRSLHPHQNRDILAARSITLETTLDKIRILFSAERVDACMYDNSPALRIALPPSLIRLQRREYYRMPAPIGNPVRVLIPLPPALGGGSAPFQLADISCGGIAILDNQRQLGDTIGKNYAGCRFELPDAGTVHTTLQIRNVQDMTLLNNKIKRRLGCQFVDIGRPMLANVQRYITRLERERNAREAGLG